MSDPIVSDPLRTYAQIASITSASIALGTLLITRLFPWLQAKLRSRALQARLGEKLYPLANLERSLRYYIPPFCQDVDPAGGDEPKLVFGVKSKLFPTLDELLRRETEYRHIVLLADSGMGKTSALLNYYSRHMKKWRKGYHLALIPLGIPDADDRITALSDKSRTVLLLDALDEDTLAIVDHAERVRILLQLTREFRKVVITCRTQFFSRDEEIPNRTAILKVGARAAGEGAEYVFHKLYLSPFSDLQIKKYIYRLYPFWQVRARKRALAMAGRIAHLSARPMLLAHIDDLVRTGRTAATAYELYDEMVRAWLVREEGFIRNIYDLREFSERLAADIYLNRQLRGAERVPKRELAVLAKAWNIPLDDWKLSGRSLLNRDAEGSFKFAHRSIMEFLFVTFFLKGNRELLQTEWTEQMRRFLREAIEGGYLVTGLQNFRDWEFLGSVHVDAILSHSMDPFEADPYADRVAVDIVAFPKQLSRNSIGVDTFNRCLQLLYPGDSLFIFKSGRDPSSNQLNLEAASTIADVILYPEATLISGSAGRYERIGLVDGSGPYFGLVTSMELLPLQPGRPDPMLRRKRSSSTLYDSQRLPQMVLIHDGEMPLACIAGRSFNFTLSRSLRLLVDLLASLSSVARDEYNSTHSVKSDPRH